MTIDKRNKANTRTINGMAIIAIRLASFHHLPGPFCMYNLLTKIIFKKIHPTFLYFFVVFVTIFV
jgi:hypothetical protein